jgi:hypothetical protein
MGDGAVVVSEALRRRLEVPPEGGGGDEPVYRPRNMTATPSRDRLCAMSHDPNTNDSKPTGFSGSLRALAALCVLLLATVGVLVVLEVIPRSAFAEVGGKILAVGGIGLVAAVAIGLLSRR